VSDLAYIKEIETKAPESLGDIHRVDLEDYPGIVDHKRRVAYLPSEAYFVGMGGGPEAGEDEIAFAELGRRLEERGYHVHEFV
jgi:hypothetical protein